MVHQRRSERGRNPPAPELTIWPVGQAVKTPASHAGNGGSIPPRVTRNNDGESRSLYTDRCRALRKQRQSPMDFEADVKATCRAIGEVGVDGA